MQLHVHSSYCAHTMQHVIVSVIFLQVQFKIFFRNNESAGRSVLVFAISRRDETWFYSYTQQKVLGQDSWARSCGKTRS